jgi:Putative phage metallopeptidase
VTTYERCPTAISAMIERALQAYHPDLKKEGVTIDCLVIRRESKKEGPVQALKQNGYPLLAKTQVTSLADRARGVADAKLVIDAYGWERISDKRRVALVDHELEHLALVHIRPTKRISTPTASSTTTSDVRSSRCVRTIGS